MSNKQPTNVMSSILRVRQDDGTFIPVFPIVTAKDVYVDINNDVTLATFLNDMSSAETVATIDDMYALTQDDVKLLDIIRVDQENRFFLVIDIENLNSELGYEELITANNNPKNIEFITYTDDDVSE